MDVASVTTSQSQCPQSGRAFYAMARGKGGFRGAVEHWRECSELTCGVSRAIHEKFPNEEEANEFAFGGSPGNAFHATAHEPKRGKAFSIHDSNPKMDSGADCFHWGCQCINQLTNAKAAKGKVAAADGALSNVIAEGTFKNQHPVKAVEEFKERLMSAATIVDKSSMQFEAWIDVPPSV